MIEMNKTSILPNCQMPNGFFWYNCKFYHQFSLVTGFFEGKRENIYFTYSRPMVYARFILFYCKLVCWQPILFPSFAILQRFAWFVWCLICNKGKGSTQSFKKNRFFLTEMAIKNTVFPHIVSAETILFKISKGHITDYINVRKLFQRGNYSREETIQGRKLGI